MLRLLTIGMLITLAAAAGFYVARFVQYPNYAEFGVIFPDPAKDYAKEFSIDRGWGCITVTVANAYENRIAAAGAPEKPSGFATSGLTDGNVPPEKFALRMSNDKRGIFLLSADQLNVGVTDAGEPIPITYNARDGSYIVANKAEGTDVTTVILDLRTLKGVISYTGQGMLGMKGHSNLIACKGAL
jgi:hypothetical protein